MTVQMNYLAIIEEITAYDHLIRMAIIPKFTLNCFTYLCALLMISLQNCSVCWKWNVYREFF